MIRVGRRVPAIVRFLQDDRSQRQRPRRSVHEDEIKDRIEVGVALASDERRRANPGPMAVNRHSVEADVVILIAIGHAPIEVVVAARDDG
jgi:hypothetical protein